MGNLFQELKRRNVYKVATVYVVISWLLLQVSDTLFPAFDMPDSAIRILAVILFIGFPLVIGLAWAFDITSDGIKKTEVAGPGENTPIRKRDYLVSALLLVLCGVVVVQQFVIFTRPMAGELVTDQFITNGEGGANAVAPEIEFENAVDEKSIAVLPLVNLSPDPDNAYFAAGIHAEILNLLQKIPVFRVIPRAAVLSYRDTTLNPSVVAQELGVGYVMAGSVRFAGNNVRVDLQLTRSSDSANLWSEQHQFELNDIFAIQSDVALQVADAMQATLSPTEIASIERPATANAEAYTLFLETMYQQEQAAYRPVYNEQGWIKTGIRNMQRALELDPSFARGLAELGYLTLWDSGGDLPLEEQNELIAEARSYSNEAIALDPTVARAYITLQRIASEARQWGEWEIIVRKSVEVPDMDGRAAMNFGMTLVNMERYQEAYYWYDVATTKNPSFTVFWAMAIDARINGRDFETALTMAERFRAVGGDENAYHAIRAYVLNRLDRPAESLAALDEMSTEPMVVAIGAAWTPGFPDYVRCQLGEEEAVLQEIDQLDVESLRSRRTRSCLQGTGNFDWLFGNLPRIMSQGGNIYYSDVRFGIKEDPRWQEIADYMNLPTIN